MNDSGAKQQIVDKIKDSSNILITVSTDPSVDELSAALGMTLLLNKMNKHATAVFSGAIPPAISFLDPEKTFEGTVDSLRDFIIALDKEKADHLRYKVDGDVVKIFITPYRTTLTQDDLDFSQGDYNVELVLALGVKNRDHLDAALEAHGRILHDATVATIGVGEAKSELGSIDWSEQNASSLSELLVGLSDALKGDKKLVDEQIATAFLTGIVAATDRFSNNRTSSRVMTIAAQLMSAGANQQLIASKLEEAHEIGDKDSGGGSNGTTGENSDGTTDLSEGEPTKLSKKSSAKKPKEPKKDDGSLVISHEKEGNIDEVAEATLAEDQEAAAEAAQDKLEKRAEEVSEAKQDDATKTAEQKLAEELATVAPTASSTSPSVADLQKDLAAANAEVDEAAGQASAAAATAPEEPESAEPSMGGTLNATTEQAAEDKRKALEDDRNHTILTHDGNRYVGDSSPTFQSPLNAVMQPSQEQPIVNPLDVAPPASPPTNETLPTPQAPAVEPPAPVFSGPTLADIDKENRAKSHEDARAAVDAAFGAVPFEPASSPQASIGAQPLGGALHDEASPPQVVSPAPSSLPPLPDFSTLPPLPQAPDFNPPAGALPPDKLEDVLTPAPSAPPPQPNDPAQFRIPGQG